MLTASVCYLQRVSALSTPFLSICARLRKVLGRTTDILLLYWSQWQYTPACLDAWLLRWCSSIHGRAAVILFATYSTCVSKSVPGKLFPHWNSFRRHWRLKQRSTVGIELKSFLFVTALLIFSILVTLNNSSNAACSCHSHPLIIGEDYYNFR